MFWVCFFLLNLLAGSSLLGGCLVRLPAVLAAFAEPWGEAGGGALPLFRGGTGGELGMFFIIGGRLRWGGGEETHDTFFIIGGAFTLR